MGNGFKEVASIRTDMDKYGDGYDRIFGKKENIKEELEEAFTEMITLPKDTTNEEHWTFPYLSEDKLTYIIPNYKIRRFIILEGSRDEWKSLAQEASDSLETLRAEIKEDMSFVLSLATYSTQQTAVKIEEIKKKYI